MGVKVFVARQPILDLQNKAYGYEFLYRDSDKNSFNTDVDGSMATRRLISNLVTEFGLRNLTGGRLAFLNFTEELLQSQYPTYLDHREVVLEILETTVPNAKLLERIRHLKEQGYRFAVDDYIGAPNAFLEYADIIKVDFRETTPEMQAKIIRSFGKQKRMLAEKVETLEDFQSAKEMGYQLFQGYYFSKPVLLSKSAIEVTSSVYWQVWREVNKLDPNIDKLVLIIQLDVGLSYQFLSIPNTVFWYRGNIVTSLKQALVNMGLREMRRRVLLVLMKNVLGEEVSESARQALVRALFASSVAVEAGYPQQEDDAYVVGMFSMLDIVLQEDKDEMMRLLQISDRAKGALLEKAGFLGILLSFVEQYELGCWDVVEEFIDEYGVDRQKLGDFYLKAVQYADIVFGLTNDNKDSVALDR